MVLTRSNIVAAVDGMHFVLERSMAGNLSPAHSRAT